MIQIRTHSFSSIKKLIHNMSPEFSVGLIRKKPGEKSITFQAETQVLCGQGENAAHTDEMLPQQDHWTLTVSEQNDGTFGVDVKLPLGFAQDGLGNPNDPIVPMSTSMSAFPNSQKEETGQFVEQRQYGLIEIDMDSYFRLLKEGPDRHGLAYFFNVLELRAFGTDALVLCPDFTKRLFLKLQESPRGGCQAVPYLLVF